MKNLFLTAAFLLSTLCVSAQSNLAVENQYPGDEKAKEVYLTAVEKQANEKTSAIRTSWLANKPNSNWFISIQGGVGGVLSDNNYGDSKPWEAWDSDKDQFWNPTYGFSVGKWFSPVWGIRLNANYGETKAFTDGLGDQVTGYSEYIDATADYMVNLKNVFRPYNPKGFFNPVLYVGAGAMYNFEIEDGEYPNFKGAWNRYSHWNLAVKAGLQFNFRLCDSWDLFLDGQTIFVPMDHDRDSYGTAGRTDFIINGSLGLTYRFNFRHFIKAPLYDQREIDALNREINALRNRPEIACPPVPVCPEPEVIIKEVQTTKEELTPVFFTIGSHVVRDNQLISVAKAAEYLINNPNAKLELASYADKKTGTPAVNMQVSKKRSDAVANVLVNKFGISKSRLVLKHYGDTVQPFDENDWNRVTIFVLP